ncbi:hypothetical protein ACHAWX_000865 [Stephanocyclus meneghinianus]
MVRKFFVCQAATCRHHGGESVLKEIEELASLVGNCVVEETGCLGLCSQAPAVVVINGRWSKERAHVRINSFEASVKVVESACDQKIPLEDRALQKRFQGLREERIRQQAVSVAHWNTALRGMAEKLAHTPSLFAEYKYLLNKAGFDPLNMTVRIPHEIENYAQWRLEEVLPVSHHSALYRFVSQDPKRGTPHIRGRGRAPELKTWHTTMLAEVGPNLEGPLPWIERDYTPVSSASEWERGRCDILIKIYANGKATSWISKLAPPCMVWLSKPHKTLHVPTLVSDGSSFSPSSVLLLLGGTGVVALPQILDHQNPIHNLGFSTHKRDRLLVPIHVFLSCRKDDILLLPQIAKCCHTSTPTSGVQGFTLFVTNDNSDMPLFPETVGDNPEEALDGIPNTRIFYSRVTSDVISDTLERMPKPCRIVVSGPDGFNKSARDMLADIVETDHITILSA